MAATTRKYFEPFVWLMDMNVMCILDFYEILCANMFYSCFHS
jgi:hypothetical protein